MSQQQVNSEEMGRGYQAQAAYPDSRERGFGPGPGLDDAFSGLSGQKLGQQSFGGSASPGQRLALAIVSLCLLVPLAGIALAVMLNVAVVGIISGLILLGVTCLTIVFINLMFNLRH